MLIRYSTTDYGKQKKLANVYSRQEHGITKAHIDKDALYVTRRLQSAGYEAYVVGGAVRDLLLNRKPKDFDIATDALPRKVRRIFANSRVIGKRFRLVHVHFQNKIVEVSTFRSDHAASFNNVFGTMAEDVHRRDFTFNALYYDPREEYIVDYVGGYKDIGSRRIRALHPADESFREDPVRMIRAVKYAAATEFALPNRMRRAIRRQGHGLATCPRSRMTEEFFKILESGHAEAILLLCSDLGILEHMLPEMVRLEQGVNGAERRVAFRKCLAVLDEAVNDEGENKRSRLLALFADPWIEVPREGVSQDPNMISRDIFMQIKEVISPLTPPNVDVDGAAKIILTLRGLTAPRRKRRRRRR